MEDTDDMDEVILNNSISISYLTIILSLKSMIMLIYRFCLAYVFRNYARIPRPVFPLIIVLIYIENLGIHNAIHLKKRSCMEMHVQRITYADGRCTVYKTYPRPPPPPSPEAALFTTGNSFQNCKGYFRKKLN